MHPNRAFHDLTEEQALAAAERVAFAHIFAVVDGGPMVAHAPIVRSGDRTFLFHLARGNRIARHLDGATMLASVVGEHGYITPNWYQPPGDQVPTWNYIGIELEGTARLMPDEALIRQLDRLAELHEPGLGAPPWTREKMTPSVFDAMRKAIQAFEIVVNAVRITNKLSQNKPAQDREGVIAGLEASGNGALAAAMRLKR